MTIHARLFREGQSDVNLLKNKFINILMNFFERILMYFGIWRKTQRKEALLNYHKIDDIDLEDPISRNCKICRQKFSHLDYVAKRNTTHFYFCREKCYLIWLQGLAGTAMI
jgi:hypothetical protein